MTIKTKYKVVLFGASTIAFRDKLKKVLPDGMHPNKEGQTIIGIAIREMVERRLKLK